jgi:hypothetical protein
MEKSSNRPRNRRPRRSPRAERIAARGASSEPAGGGAPTQPLWGVALLRIALELKKRRAAPLKEIVSRVLTSMEIREPEFRQYLAREGVLHKLEKMSRG